MRITKMQGAGNDFIIINNIEEQIPENELNALAARLCERRRCIGADGMMAVQKATLPGMDYAMLFFNADGSLGEMCGNGARCICRYGYEMGLAGEVQHVQTTAGPVTGVRLDRSEYRVRLNDATVFELGREIETEDSVRRTAYVELGNPGIPHAVLEVPALAEMSTEAVTELGRTLRHHPAFPKGANVNMYAILGENHVMIRTFERGVEDLTLACGTGSASTAAVLLAEGKCAGDEIRCEVPGGTLKVSVQYDGKGALPHDILLTGPTLWVMQGEVGEEVFF